AGAAAALALARAGRSVLLADAGAGPAKLGEALPAVAKVLLRDLGAGEQPLSEGHLTCYANQSGWGSAALGSTDFIRDPNGPGWHLDRARFDQGLREAAHRAGAEPAAHTTVRGAARQAGGWTVTMRERGAAARQVRCRWLVDATGRRRAVTARLPAAHRRTDQLFASCLELAPDPAGRAASGSSLVEAVADGWWYTAPLPGGRRLLAYFTDADLTGPLGPAEFHCLLGRTRHVAPRAAAHPLPEGAAPRRAPAHSAHLDTPVGAGWLAVGDAATAFDPVSSQGILTALHTGMTGGLALHAHLDGDPAALDSYRTNVRALLAAYRRNHHAVYALERRWADRPFWQRRHIPSTERNPG
ncbi:NAD(P)/FAD-dependent oxidoreductase, partial [Kitasatospora sp. P5_F3]